MATNSNINIYFENPNNKYSGGHTVSGKIKINFETVEILRGISVEIKGEAYCSWTETKRAAVNTGARNDGFVTYVGNEEYFYHKYYVVGDDYGDTVEIPKGPHTYQFRYVLPKDIPSSIEEEYGYIRYTVKVNLNRPWKMDNYETAAFIIEAPLDAKNYPTTNEPGTILAEKYFGCLCCKSGPLAGILKIPYTKFKCGQILPATLEIDNASQIAVRGLIVRFNKVVKYYSNFPSIKDRKYEIELAKYYINTPVGPHCSLTLNQNIEVPDFLLCNIAASKIMDLGYEIQIEADIVGCHINLSGSLPVYPDINK